MEIPDTPTIAVPEVLMGLILVHLAHDRNHEDLLRADYDRLKELGATHLIDEARRNGQI